jgi:hypothetical protein
VIFVPYEVYELTKTISALKVLALVINLAIVAYLLSPSGCSGCAAAARPSEPSRSGKRLGASRARHPPAVHPHSARRRFSGPGRQPGMGRGDRSCSRLTTSATGATTTMEEDPARAARCHKLIKQAGGSGQAGPALH